VRTRYGHLLAERREFHAAAPCPVDVKAKMIEWWGTDPDRVLRRFRKAMGITVSDLAAVGCRTAGTVGPRPSSARSGSLDEDDSGIAGPGRSARLYFADAPLFSYHKRSRRRRKARLQRQGGWSTLGDVGYSRRRGPFSISPTRKSYMIIFRRREHLPAGDRGRADHPSRDRRCRGVFGVPNEEMGEGGQGGGAAARHGRGRGKSWKRKLILFLPQANLSPIKCPKSIDFEAELPPPPPTGKLVEAAFCAESFIGQTAW